jgi:hypothetical protein
MAMAIQRKTVRVRKPVSSARKPVEGRLHANGAKLASIMNLVDQLSLEEGRQLNKYLCSRLRAQFRAEDAKSAAKWCVGDRVLFDAKRRGIIYGQIISVGTKVKVQQYGEFGRTWRVSPSLLNKDANPPKAKPGKTVIPENPAIKRFLTQLKDRRGEVS